MRQSVLILLPVLAALAGCGSLPPGQRVGSEAPLLAERPPASDEVQEKTNAIVMFALGLIDTGYRFGGKNPSAGFDCSGMVSYIFEQAAGIRVKGSAADIALHGKPVDLRQLRPGDLLFFNTRNKPFSHVGIYIGEDRFVHAPSESGRARVRTENIKSNYFATRLEAARSLLD